MLIGSSRFSKDPENLPAIPGVVCNVVDFERLLLDPGIVGVPSSNIVRLLDEPSIATVQETVAEKSKEATDLFLLYYTGHGLISRKGELLLTLPGSTLANSSANCVPWDTLKEFIAASPATNKLIVLDCCFSGRALEFMSPADEVTQQALKTQGAVVLTSSARSAPSLAPDGERRTAFTDALLQLLEQGIDNGRTVISVNEAFAGAQQSLTSRDLPEPRSLMSDNASDLAWVRNTRTLGADASTIAATDAIFRNIEHSLTNYVESRLAAKTEAESHDDHDVPIPPVFSIMVGTVMAIVFIAEAWFILYLGAHATNDTGKIIYPRLVGFAILTASVFTISTIVALIGLTSHRKPWHQTALSALVGNRRWARQLTMYAVLNILLVLVVSVVAVSAEVIYVDLPYY